MRNRYEYKGTTVSIAKEEKEEFIRLLKRGVLLSLQKSGVLSVSQLQQCLDSIERRCS